MTYAGPAEETSPTTRAGGLPLVPEDFAWPQCTTCEAPMMFVTQLRLEDLAASAPDRFTGGEGFLSIWVCQDDPGMCDSWAPFDGSNAAWLFHGTNLVPAPGPKAGATLRPDCAAASLERVDTEDYDDARMEWAEKAGASAREVLGALGGEPSWLQGEEVPDCPSCEQPMAFAAHVEQGHDHQSEVNFGGGGCGYAFVCGPCTRAAFVWQS